MTIDVKQVWYCGHCGWKGVNEEPGACPGCGRRAAIVVVRDRFWGSWYDNASGRALLVRNHYAVPILDAHETGYVSAVRRETEGKGIAWYRLPETREETDHVNAAHD